MVTAKKKRTTKNINEFLASEHSIEEMAEFLGLDKNRLPSDGIPLLSVGQKMTIYTRDENGKKHQKTFKVTGKMAQESKIKLKRND